MTRYLNSRRGRSGFTLIEILWSVGLVSLLAAGALIFGSWSTQQGRAVKLRSDVAMLNRAMLLHAASTGASPSTAEEALLFLKSKAADARATAGLTGQMIDPRTAPEYLSPEESLGDGERAVWVAAEHRFVIRRSGANGIARFVLDEAAAAATIRQEDRVGTYALNRESGWIWANQPASPPADAPIPQGVGIREPRLADGETILIKLAQPVISLAAGTYPLADYPQTVTLTDANPAGYSQLDYSISGGASLPYTGPFEVLPGQTVVALARARDPESYIDSDPIAAAYTTDPVMLEAELIFTKNAYNYAELGGPVMVGSFPIPASAAPGQITLNNPAAVPSPFFSSRWFRAVWTVDGTDPLSAATASSGPDFSGTMPPVNVAVTVQDWGTATTLNVQAALRSSVPAVFTSSSVKQRQLGIEKLMLPPPIVNLAAGDLDLQLDPAAGIVPVGAFIQFTTDGTDPGDGNGAPLTGIRYNGTVPLSTLSAGLSQIVARVYPPEATRQWFTPSLTAEGTVLQPGEPLYVGGVFERPVGNPLRNIARLDGAGNVDPTFNTGMGASAGSMIGVVRMAGSGVFAGGNFGSMNGVAQPAFVRLMPGGGVDASFNAGLRGE